MRSDEDQEAVAPEEPLDETLASLPSDENTPLLLNVLLEEELYHSKSASLRVINALKRNSILPLGDHSDHLSFGEC